MEQVKKEVPHHCDCWHCDVEYDEIDVAEGPITPEQHVLQELTKTIYGPRVARQLVHDSDWLRKQLPND